MRQASAAPERGPAPLAPLGRKMRQRIARGSQAIGGRLDLHGLTQHQAHDALVGFLRSAQDRGHGLVLVITGKGMPGDSGDRGVLRRQVPHWLRLPGFRDVVLGFECAHVAHGGDGALYVRLRRRRD
jgi:DNA-nicking Smr family endonuclease